MRYFMFWLRFLLLLPFLSVHNIQETLSLSVSNSSRHLCHYEEGTALLGFVRDFTIDNSLSFSPTNYPNIRSWRNNTDCCSWDGILCDSLSGHVIELDLSCAQILGTIDSNSSLFQLQQLQSLNLAFNDFYNSPISPKIGKFSHLRYLNLSSAGFSGIVPTEIANLSQLISLDLSTDVLKLLDLALITESMTGLTQLHLSGVSVINSVIPPSLANLTSLSSLVLDYCGLQGSFPLAEILQFPRIRNLVISEGKNLYNADISRINWSGFLEHLELSSPNFTGKLPKSPGPTKFLRELNLLGSNFYGDIPPWVWNTTIEIKFSRNQFSGELPSLLNTSKLSKLDFISLSFNNLSGKIPPWIFTLPSLSTLMLDNNRFSGQLVIEDVNPSPSLQSLFLESNMLNGSIPTSISKLQSLEYLSLNSNMFTGTVELSVFYKLRSLTSLLLSNNNLSLSINDETPTQPPQFIYLYLSSCNLGKFPNFLIGQDYLQELDLSNNNIHGQIPPWFLEKNLNTLDLSHNNLRGGLEHIPWESLAVIYLHNNMFEGPLPQPNPSIIRFIVSNNGFTGEIPSTICNLTEVIFLDLSNNSLTGHIPPCLGNLGSDELNVLDLSSNKLQGTLPPNFTKCGNLTNLNLNGNQLEGHVPSSLSSCLSLKVLDLGKNMLSGTFPHWLGKLTELEVLVLHSNRFEGPLIIEQDVESPFPKLRILDIANNRLSGNLPHKLIMSLKAMMKKIEGDTLQYMDEYFSGMVLGYYYMYSFELTIKGSNRNLDKVLSVLVAIDVSSNMFEGDISSAIGDLLSLRGLNLSHNNFSGTIPSSLSKLVMLEALDISSNELVGQIPKDLESLTSLEFFNVSRNQLVGPIPVGNQFSTFGNDSFLDNAGLCGIPLSKTCGADVDDDATTEPPPTVYHNFVDLSIWEMVLMGYGFGMVLGLLIGCFIFLARTPFCVSRLICRVEFMMEQHSKKRRRRRLA